MTTINVVPEVSFVYRNIFFGVDQTPLFTPLSVGAEPWDANLSTYTKTWTSWDAAAGISRHTAARGDIPADTLTAIGAKPITGLTCHLTLEYGDDDHAIPPRVIILLGDPFGGGVYLICPASPDPSQRTSFAMTGFGVESYDTNLWASSTSPTGEDATPEEIDAAFKQGYVHVMTPLRTAVGSDFSTWVTTYELTFDVTYAGGIPPRRIFGRSDGLTHGAKRVLGGGNTRQSGSQTLGAVL